MAAAGTETTGTTGAGNPLDRAREALARLSNRQKVVLMVSIAAVIALLVAAATLLRQSEFRILFSNITERDGGAIIASLEQMNIPFKFNESGSAILVPSNRVHDVRLRLASQGLPRGGAVGFELMESQKFGISQFAEQVNYQRGLEGELSRTIQSVAAVQAARVHLAIPKPSVFMREELKPSASVMLNLYPGRSLDAAQIAGIQNLVAASVPQLAASSVTLLDQSGTLLSQMKSKLLEAGLDPTQVKYIQEGIYVVSCGTGGGLVVLRGRRCQGRTKSGRSRTLDIAAPSLTLPPGRGRQPAALGMEDNSGLPSLDRFPMIETLFTQALGLVAPWQVDQVIFTPEAGRIDFQVTFSAAVHACPACRTAAQPLHDRLARSWRHLDFFQYEAHLHAAVPRVACAVCDKVTQIPVPWAREGSRFTLLFEALTLMLAPTMSVLAAGRLLRVRSRRLWRVIEHHVNKARAKESHAEVRAIGVDETASKRGQTYITVFHDLDKPRLLFATPGRDKATLGMFATDLTEHGGQPSAITHVSMDMSGSFQAGAAEHFPEAEVCFDRFHVVALGSTALDEVRRAEVKSEPELKGTRWSLHKKPADWTIKQTQTMHWLQRSNLKTARAWRIKEALRAIYATAKTPDEAKPLLKRWLSWACRCRLEPFKRLGRTITKHLPGVLNGFESGKHNGRVEAMNRALQEARARARGYRRVDNFIAMAYLIAGKLIHLPVSPFVPFRPVPHETT
jgi:transposase